MYCVWYIIGENKDASRKDMNGKGITNLRSDCYAFKETARYIGNSSAKPMCEKKTDSLTPN